MTREYAIRLAALEDIPRLPEIERSAAALFAPYGLQQCFATIVTPMRDLERGQAAGVLWVAAGVNGEPVGFALAGEVGGNAHLDELDVLPAHGRRGIGRALVQTVVAWARATGFEALTLTTLRHVPWNAPFYETLGFRALAEAELSAALRTLLQEEIARGLPAANRVAMRCDLHGA
jgi:GNAT superfamily N-acetyltransferase